MRVTRAVGMNGWYLIDKRGRSGTPLAPKITKKKLRSLRPLALRHPQCLDRGGGGSWLLSLGEVLLEQLALPCAICHMPYMQ
jgi:hypothetical protein